jgi:hypothetical protein
VDRADISDVIAKFPAEVRERFDFSAAVYHGALAPITNVICSKHGAFKQYPAQLRRNGATCQGCGAEVWSTKKRQPARPFVEQAREVHGSFYDYSKTVYTRSQDKLTVTCPTHGDFLVAANNHLSGRGCPACGALKRGHRKDIGTAARTTADSKMAAFGSAFADDARKVHGDKYDYSGVVYAGRKQHVTIVCRDHGAFEQTPERHLYRAHGCPQCSHHRSKDEAEVLAFVSIFAEPVSRDRTVIPPKELDVYVPAAKLALEYCGEYWHGSDSAEDEPAARKRHAQKHKACADLGIRLLTIYASEWTERKAAIKRLIRNALGKGRGSVMARKCEVLRVSHGDAHAFYEKYHPQGGGGFGDNYGLYLRGKLLACMRFTLGANDRGANVERVWTLSRYATRLSVPGGASRLFAAFVKDRNPPLVKSFSDNRYFTGGMYERLSFMLEETTPPDYQVWHQKLGLTPKTSWQRRTIPRRIRELGSKETFDPARDVRSERDMTYLLGAHRVFDCGKKRWIWTPPA